MTENNMMPELTLEPQTAEAVPTLTLEPELDTVVFPARPEHQHISSTMVREMIRYGQPMERYVPAAVVRELNKRK